MTLTADGVHSRPGISGSPTLGRNDLAPDISSLSPNGIYTVHFRMFDASADASLNVTTGVLSTTTVHVTGTQQVETATVLGSITGAGNAKAVITAAGMTGSPKTITAAVEASDTASEVATALGAAIAADADVTALFTVQVAVANITLIRKQGPMGERYANDATLNIAIDNDTCTGLTAAPTSTNSASGVASSGTELVEAGGEDFEGLDPNLGGECIAMLLERVQTGGTGVVTVKDGSGTPGSLLTARSTGLGGHIYITGAQLTGATPGADLDFTTTGKAEIKLHMMDA